MAKIYRDELIKQIAKDLYLRRDVVEDVLESFTNLMVEEIVNQGEFRIKNILTVDSAEWGSYSLDGKTIPAHSRLKVRLSSKLKKLFKKYGPGSVEHGTLTRNNWTELDTTVETKNNEKKISPSNVAGESDHELVNPFIDDDY